MVGALSSMVGGGLSGASEGEGPHPGLGSGLPSGHKHKNVSILMLKI